MRAYVLDTDVLVAALRSDAGASRQVLEAAGAHRFELLLSVPLMLEYESVLTRPEHLAACGASREDVSAVLDELALVGKRVELMIRTRPMLPDPNDEMVLETAINGRADAIVTFNERDFRPVAARFRCSVAAFSRFVFRKSSCHVRVKCMVKCAPDVGAETPFP
jgi:putative PIN family toxin of toxin-antitoxin system